MFIDIKGREILTPDIKLFKGERNIDRLSFLIGLKYEGVLLDELKPYITVLSPDGERIKKPLNKSRQNDKLKLDWHIGKDETGHAGILNIQISFEDSEGETVFNTKPRELTVNETIDVNRYLLENYNLKLIEAEVNLKKAAALFPKALSELENDLNLLGESGMQSAVSQRNSQKANTHALAVSAHTALVSAEIGRVRDLKSKATDLKNRIKSVKRYIDLADFVTGGVRDNAGLSQAIAAAASDKISGDVRAEIVFYNSSTDYFMFENVDFVSNTNYRDASFDAGGSSITLELKNISDCTFSGFAFKSVTGFKSLSIKNCENLLFENCPITNQMGDCINIENSSGIIFENCTLTAASYTYILTKIIDTLDTPGIITFENCFFNNSSDYVAVDTTGVTNEKLTVIIDNCYYKGFTNVFTLNQGSCGRILQIKGTQI